MNRLSSVVAASSIVLFACGGGATNSPPPQAGASTAPPANFGEQVARGQKLYADNCASCHGASGEGGKGPKVVGLSAGALPLDPASGSHRKTQFKTVADVADFVVKNMPPGEAGSLPADDYYAILAFDLKANGIDLGDKKLDATLAPTLTIPR